MRRATAKPAPAWRPMAAVLATVALAGVACTDPAPADPAACADRYADGDRLRAMVIVQTLAQAWSAAPVEDHAAVVLPPSHGDVAWALALLRCDHGARARSRRMRAIAKLLAHDWSGARSTPLLLELGFSDAAIAAFKGRIVAGVPPPAFALYARDLEWLEYAVLRHVTITGDLPVSPETPGARWILGPAPAYAAGPVACWRPEAKSTNEFVDPYVKLTAHVSVDVAGGDAQKNVDAQRWDECGTFWSPPDPSNPGQALDGAEFVQPTWTPCKMPSRPLTPETSPPPYGTPYQPPHMLFEQFLCPLSTGDAHFDNILAVWVFPTQVLAAGGTQVAAQQLSFRLGSCGNDQVEGAMGGAIGGATMKTVLDSGYIQVWTEGGRTHVASLKKVELSDRGANWLTQFNPALDELNDELGELACCLH